VVTTNNFPAQTPRKLFVGPFQPAFESALAAEIAAHKKDHGALAPLTVVVRTHLLCLHLLFCEKGKWVLVDYKTDAQVEVKRYVEQVRAYESALKRAVWISLAEKAQFFLASGTVEQVGE
jgi:ATP-dependent exoDNAse (exonuclease V) beta subunit